MTQAQLLALDTILPTVLGCVGLVFLAAAMWPLGSQSRTYAMRSVVLGVVGVGCIAVGVWLWLAVLRTAGQLIVQPLPPPGGTSSVTTAQKPSPAASSAAPVASAPATSAAASAPASAVASASLAASPSAAAPTAVPTVAATPTIPPNLTPVPTATFQPESTPPHAAIVGVQSFEHGSMLYRDDLKQIYVMTLDQKFTVYPDNWKEGVNPDLGAVEGAKFRPGRGFGWLWASNPDVRQALGLGVTQEQGFTGSISGDGNATTIRADSTYAFNKDRTWTLK